MILTMTSWKGGSGKTSIGASVAEQLSKKGDKILIIDLDSNLSMTSIYNRVNSNTIYNSIELLNGNLNFIPTKTHNKNIDLIPSDLRISRLNNISDRVLKINISKINLSEYNYILIDPPGCMNSLTRNSFMASEKVIIPAMFSDLDFQATKLMLDELEMCGTDADISIVLNRFDQKRSPEYIEKWFREDENLNPFMWSGKIPAMRSISRLTSEVNQGYELKGKAKQIIDALIEEVILG